MHAAVTLSALCLLFCAPPAYSARILGLFPHSGKTHYIVFEPLLKELARRGHELVVVSHFPQDEPVRNFRDISLTGAQENLAGKLVFDDLAEVNSFLDFMFITDFGHQSCEPILSHPPVKRLIHSNERFDLIITEAFNTNCFLGFMHRFRPAPYIAMSSCMLMSWDWQRVGNPLNTAYFPQTMLWFSDEMKLWERVLNTVFTAGTNLYMKYHWDRLAQSIVEKHFGPGVPPLKDLENNVSLLLVNSHPALTRVKPLVPAVIEIGGIHIPDAKKLPQDLEEFVSGAKDGVVLFSMGSMIKASSLPKSSAAEVLAALGTLKQRVIWKWESAPPGPVPKNVRMMPWLPQFDVLCHPNTRLFIGHGGLLSTSEAAHCGVPLLGIAMYGDQRTNLAAAAKSGAARSLPYSALTAAPTFIKNVKEMLEDPSYRENARILSKRFRDRPMSPLETATWWTEYVLRNKGAAHLHGAAKKLTWWQESLLDVIAVVILAIVAAIVVLVGTCRALLKLVRAVRGPCLADKKKKA